MLSGLFCLRERVCEILRLWVGMIAWRVVILRVLTLPS